jgi:HK97 family phage prohead protease
MDKFVSTDKFRELAREDAGLHAPVLRLATGPATEVEGETRTLRFCFSDGTVDRVGDTINPKGWELAEFLKNPVALWAHSSWDPPVGKAHNVSIVGKRLMGDIEFAPLETYAFADTIYQLAKGGYINAVSVGFQPLEWSFVDDKDRPFGIDFKRQQLLEISICPVPCNANALVDARAKGIDTGPVREWAERVLDEEGGKVVLSRTTLEEIFKATNTPHAARARYRQLIEHKPGDETIEVAELGTVTVGADAKALVEKAGRRISTKNMDCLGKAIDHIKSVMDSNEPDDADPAEEEGKSVAEVVVPVVDATPVPPLSAKVLAQNALADIEKAKAS